MLALRAIEAAVTAAIERGSGSRAGCGRGGGASADDDRGGRQTDAHPAIARYRRLRSVLRTRSPRVLASDGVTVVYGDNMVGKTSLMNAVRFAFFGEIHGRGERTRGLLSACNRDLADEGKFEFVVDLSVGFDGARLRHLRESEVPCRPRRRPTPTWWRPSPCGAGGRCSGPPNATTLAARDAAQGRRSLLPLRWRAPRPVRRASRARERRGPRHLASRSSRSSAFRCYATPATT